MAYKKEGRRGLAVGSDNGDSFTGLQEGDEGFPGMLDDLLSRGDDALNGAAEVLTGGDLVDRDAVTFLPPVARPQKIICLGLNYLDHAREAGFELPDYPIVFARFASSLIGHDGVMIRPKISEKLDYEGELAAVIGKGGHGIPESEALAHVAGYSVFNDGSVRDYQFRTPQWTVGKNFDGTGVFGPCLVTPEAVPAGAAGLKIETRLNGEVMQSSNTDQLIFSVAKAVSLLSQAMTLEPGDVFIMGTPAGIGSVRKPPVFLEPGDVCEVEIEKLGVLRSHIEDEK